MLSRNCAKAGMISATVSAAVETSIGCRKIESEKQERNLKCFEVPPNPMPNSRKSLPIEASTSMRELESRCDGCIEGSEI